MREELSRYQSRRPCETCDGARLSPSRWRSRSPARTSRCRRAAASPTRSPGSARSTKLTPQQNEIARAILKEINERLGFLHNVGLDYLHLDRTSGTLSGGESQRIRLAIQIGTRPRRACSTCSTSPRSASTRRTTTGCWRRSSASAASATRCSWSSMTRTRSAPPTMSSTWAPAPASTAARWSCEGTLDDLLACENSLTADYLSGRREIPLPRHPPQGLGQAAHRPRRARQQPAQRHRRLPARHLHLRHRRLAAAASRALTIDTLYAGAARALNGARIVAGPHDEDHRPRASRQGDRHRPVADRPHPALQPRDLHRRLHPDPRLVRRPARKPGARLQARPLQLQRQGRPLRGVPGRRPDQDRDALPARRLRHLRGMPRRSATTARRSR